MNSSSSGLYTHEGQWLINTWRHIYPRTTFSILDNLIRANKFSEDYMAVRMQGNKGYITDKETFISAHTQKEELWVDFMCNEEAT